MLKMKSDAHLYLAKSEAELLHEIGEKSEISLSSFPKSYDDIINDGKNWLNENLSDLQYKICSDDLVKQLLETNGVDDVTLFSAVVDLIASLCIGFAPFSVAALLIKRGLYNLCRTV
jgi:hypothetical protein